MSLSIVRRALGVENDATGRVTVTRHGRATLLRLFREIGSVRGAEIGVWRGGFSALMCQAVPGLSLRCVDPWAVYDGYREQKNVQEHLDQAHAQAVAALAPYQCDLMRMPSRDAAATVPDGSLDFVYIDGNHRRAYVDADLSSWVPKVRPGGIVSGHDYVSKPSKPHTEVKPAVDAFTRDRGIDPWFVLAGDKTPSFMWVAS